VPCAFRRTDLLVEYSFESKDIWRADDYSARPPIRGANIASIWA